MYKANSKKGKPREHTLILRKTSAVLKIELYHTDDEGKHSFIIALSETVAENHLHRVRDQLLTMTSGVNSKKVYLSGAPFAALKFVVDLGIKDGPKTYIRVRDRPLKMAIALFQASQVLGLEPAQPHIENHIVGHVSHEKLDAEEIAAMDLAFGAEGLENRCWRTMVDHLGWLFVKERWTEAELEGVMPAIRALPALDRAVDEKVKALRRLQEDRARMKGKVCWACYARLKGAKLIARSTMLTKPLSSQISTQRLPSRVVQPQKRCSRTRYNIRRRSRLSMHQPTQLDFLAPQSIASGCPLSKARRQCHLPRPRRTQLKSQLAACNPMRSSVVDQRPTQLLRE